MNSSVNSLYRLTHAPLILQAYLVFVLVASALSFSGFYAPRLNAAIIPYTGWSALSWYLFTLFFAVAAILTPQRKQMIHAVAALLGLAVLFGALDTFNHTIGPEARTPDFGNPYLIYHPYRPVFTVALPLSWLLLLNSPFMSKWIKTSNESSLGP